MLLVIGIRTPWTLSSERSWSRAHRLGGWPMTILGVAIAVSALGSAPLPWVLIGGAGLLIAILLACSYREWRRDPDKQPVGRRPGVG